MYSRPHVCMHAIAGRVHILLSPSLYTNRHRHRHTRTWKKALGEMRKLSPRMLSENESSPDTSVTPVSSFALHKRRPKNHTETCKMNIQRKKQTERQTKTLTHMRSRGYVSVSACLSASSCLSLPVTDSDTHAFEGEFFSNTCCRFRYALGKRARSAS